MSNIVTKLVTSVFTFLRFILCYYGLNLLFWTLVLEIHKLKLGTPLANSETLHPLHEMLPYEEDHNNATVMWFLLCRRVRMRGGLRARCVINMII